MCETISNNNKLRICIVANSGFTVINFRAELIRKLVRSGVDVYVACPFDCELMHGRDTTKELNALGATHLSVDVSRTGLNPLTDIRFCYSLWVMFKNLKPDVVLNYTVKATTYGSIAASLAKVDQIASNITGIGSMMVSRSLKSRLVTIAIKLLYKLSLNRNTVVFFQNPDDKHLFVSNGLVENSKTKVINGSGVDTKKFKRIEVEPIPKSFIFVGRYLQDKGIMEYIQAAEVLKGRFPEARFTILGDVDTNSQSLSEQRIQELAASGVISNYGYRENVIPALSEHEVFVLPSYREGTPRSALEAMSLGMPLIVADSPGCKETVVNGKNGFTVSTKSVPSLVHAMEAFIQNRDLVKTMGPYSRKLVEEKFEVEKVIDSILSAVPRLSTLKKVK